MFIKYEDKVCFIELLLEELLDVSVSGQAELVVSSFSVDDDWQKKLIGTDFLHHYTFLRCLPHLAWLYIALLPIAETPMVRRHNL